MLVVGADGQLPVPATPSSSFAGITRLGVGSLQHVTHSFRSCISRASLPPPQPARLFHRYLRLPRRSQLKCGKLQAKVKAVFAAFRTRLKFVLQSTTTTTITRSTFSEEASKDCTFLLSASDNENQNENESHYHNQHDNRYLS